jgi:hypothetical protein
MVRFLTETDYLAAVCLDADCPGLHQRENLERRYERANGRAMSAASALAALRRPSPNAAPRLALKLPTLADPDPTPVVAQLPPASRLPKLEVSRRPGSRGSDAAPRRRRGT